MFHKRDDGTYAFTTRFWVTACISLTLICIIMWRTQATANSVEKQAQDTANYASTTNECLSDVVTVLTTRVGYNEEIDKLDVRRQDLDLRRQAVWEKLVDDLANADNSAGLSREALTTFKTDNAEIKIEQAKIAEDQAKLATERAQNQYPDCSANLAGVTGK